MDFKAFKQKVAQDQANEAARKNNFEKPYLYKPQNGDCVRIVEHPILAALNNGSGDIACLIWYHYDPKPIFLCPLRNGMDDSCPVCTFVKEAYADKTDEMTKLAGKYKAGRRYVTYVLHRGHEAEGIKMWYMNTTQYETIKREMMKSDLDILDLESGYDIEISDSIKKTNDDYKTFDVAVARRSSSIGITREQLADFIDKAPEILEGSVQFSVDEIEAMLVASLSGGTASATPKSPNNYFNRGLAELYRRPASEPAEPVVTETVIAPPVVTETPDAGRIANIPELTNDIPFQNAPAAPVAAPAPEPVVTAPPVVSAPPAPPVAAPKAVSKEKIGALFQRKK